MNGCETHYAHTMCEDLAAADVTPPHVLIWPSLQRVVELFATRPATLSNRVKKIVLRLANLRIYLVLMCRTGSPATHCVFNNHTVLYSAENTNLIHKTDEYGGRDQVLTRG